MKPVKLQTQILEGLTFLWSGLMSNTKNCMNSFLLKFVTLSRSDKNEVEEIFDVIKLTNI
jgi:hypothetical protein